MWSSSRVAALAMRHLNIAIRSSVLLTVMGSSAGASEWRYSWIEQSPDNQYLAVGVCKAPLSDQVDRYREDWENLTLEDIEAFKRSVADIATRFPASGVYRNSVTPELFWTYEAPIPPALVSSDGLRLAVAGSRRTINETIVVTIYGPDGYLLEVSEQDLLTDWTRAIRLTLGGGIDLDRSSIRINGQTGNTLIVNSYAGDTIEFRMSDGSIVNSDALANAFAALAFSKGGLVVLGITGVLLVVVLARLLTILRKRSLENAG